MAGCDSVENMQEEISKPDSPKNVENEDEPVFVRPVISVKCLHEYAEEISSKSSDCSSPKYISFDEVPELFLNSLEKDNPQNKSHEPEAGSKEQPPILESTNQTVSLVNIPIQPQPIARIYRPGFFPERFNFKGIHNFTVEVDTKVVTKKTEYLAYSKSRNKLYVTKGSGFRILVSADNVPAGSCIKVIAEFCCPEDTSHPVQRCPTHAQQDFAKGNPAFEHFVQFISDNAVYEKDLESGRCSVSIPYEKPQDGVTFSPYIMKLTCFSSCSGGINRKPFSLVFTLEKDKIPVGKQIIEAKVCACPVRDCKIDDEKEDKKRLKDDLEENNVDIWDLRHRGTRNCVDENSEKRQPQSSSSNGQKYTITVKDLESYEFLKHMKVLYENGIHKIPSDT